MRVSARDAVLLTAILAVAVTLLMSVTALDPALGTRRFHVGLQMAEAMVLVFVATVLFGRYRYAGSRRNTLMLAAVVVIAVKNVCFALATAISQENLPGDHFTVWATAINGLIGAAMLAGAALVPDRWARPGHIGGILGLSVAVVAATFVVAAGLADVLPNAFQTDDVPGPIPTSPLEASELGLLGGHPVKIIIDVFTAAAYAVAALAFANHADRHGDEFIRWLSISAVIAGVSYVDYALSPSRYARLFYGGELLWIGAIGTLLYGAIREISNLEAALVRSVLLEERLRVARDLHNGVAQELVYLTTQADWHRWQPTDRQQVAKIMDAAERALEESRGAIAGLSRPIGEPLSAALKHAAIDVADRMGARLSVDIAEELEVAPPWRDALLRITRQAVADAVRYGRARTISLELRRGDGIRLRITDDSAGFGAHDPRSRQAFGLAGIRELAESLGGRVETSSIAGKGSTIEIVIP